jgi:hypothetical protein
MITEGILRDRDEMDEKHTSTQTQQTAVCVLTAWITQLRDSLRQDDGIGGVPIESASSCMPKQRPPRPIHAILVYFMLHARHRRSHTRKVHTLCYTTRWHRSILPAWDSSQTRTRTATATAHPGLKEDRRLPINPTPTIDRLSRRLYHRRRAVAMGMEIRGEIYLGMLLRINDGMGDMMGDEEVIPEAGVVAMAEDQAGVGTLINKVHRPEMVEVVMVAVVDPLLSFKAGPVSAAR